ncbi:MAG: hypothetical protein ACI90V_012622, partial [Bacillariaceae sp.]
MFASRLASSLSRSSSVLLRSGFGKQLQQQQQQQQHRFMSVINISDHEATDKFTKMNEKSILYFTATWYVQVLSLDRQDLGPDQNDVLSLSLSN